MPKAAGRLAAISNRSRPPTRFPIADHSSARQHDAVTNNPAILDQLPLSDIDAVVFYRRDEITTDLICCDVAIQGRVWTFHEEAAVWPALTAHLSAAGISQRLV